MLNKENLSYSMLQSKNKFRYCKRNMDINPINTQPVSQLNKGCDGDNDR